MQIAMEHEIDIISGKVSRDTYAYICIVLFESIYQPDSEMVEGDVNGRLKVYQKWA